MMNPFYDKRRIRYKRNLNLTRFHRNGKTNKKTVDLAALCMENGFSDFYVCFSRRDKDVQDYSKPAVGPLIAKLYNTKYSCSMMRFCNLDPKYELPN